MGFLGGDNESAAERSINEERKRTDEELRLKKENLYKTRLDIIKSQGRESWTPDYARLKPKKADSSNSFPFGGNNPLLGQP